MIKLFTCAAILFCLTLGFVAPAHSRDVTVLVSLEVLHSLTEALVKETAIKVVQAYPKGYFMAGTDAYFHDRQESFFKIVAESDAVITIKSAWTADSLYQWARRGNIRIVNIDAAKPLDESGAAVAVTRLEGKYSPYVWRSPANLTRMAFIVGEDLCQLSPQDAPKIRENLKRLQTALFTLRNKYQAAFLELDSVDMAAFTSRYTYLVNEFELNTVFYELKPEIQWNETDVCNIAARIRGNGIKAVLCAWKPNEKGLEAICEGGAVPVVLDRYVRKEHGRPAADLIAWFDTNLSRLYLALKASQHK